MIIKKRYVYIDTPQLIKSENVEKNKDLPSEDNKEIQKDILLEEAKKEAAKIVNEAKTNAKNIIESAKKEAEEIKNRALEEISQIKNKELEEINQKINNLNQKIISISNNFEEKLEKKVNELSNEMLYLIKTIIQKFLEKEIDVGVTKRKLEKVLMHIIGMKNVKLYLNSEDIKLLDEETLNHLRYRGIEIIEDNNVHSGVIAETESGTINTSLNFQIKLINEIIDEVLNNE
ncbi:MAG: flagellar assembly protein FliH [Thermosipho sp. (in: thermotogales)]|nr:flagellar assembly protein FliH [Thermosipho sp. (in: thermotogales)]MDK2899850.1 flagellar assembly protein FliH [Thermosipho sp. (in: thermotogales)]